MRETRQKISGSAFPGRTQKFLSSSFVIFSGAQKLCGKWNRGACVAPSGSAPTSSPSQPGTESAPRDCGEDRTPTALTANTSWITCRYEGGAFASCSAPCAGCGVHLPSWASNTKGSLSTISPPEGNTVKVLLAVSPPLAISASWASSLSGTSGRAASFSSRLTIGSASIVVIPSTISLSRSSTSGWSDRLEIVADPVRELF
ncbi:hypothetical protein XELAEV_18009173mg [Xenopus laevis]|uniref:Uncharacterized protein n=1 Tax=Xenopus laevis TaxID=8355 RepID=A0A974DRX1_XENLA|nr:hypothetical protein XELAEV_18009173mg [Xenopus laevis]